MKPSASGFGFWGAAGCAVELVEAGGKGAQSVRSEGDRSFGFWPRTTSRGKACAGGAAQAVVSLRDVDLEDVEQAVVSLRDVDLDDVEQAVVSLREIDLEEVEREVTSS